jgi:hypothetical protein
MDRFLRALLKTGAYFLDQAGDATTTVKETVRDRAADLSDRTARLVRSRESHLLRDLLTFAAGASVGIGVGILCAPRSGAETRNALADRLQEVGVGVKKHFSGEPETREPVADVA